MDDSQTGESPSVTTNAVGLRPKHIYGLRTDVLGNIHFNQQQEVIYPVEGVLAFHDFVENKQRFLRYSLSLSRVLRINSLDAS